MADRSPARYPGVAAAVLWLLQTGAVGAAAALGGGSVAATLYGSTGVAGLAVKTLAVVLAVFGVRTIRLRLRADPSVVAGLHGLLGLALVAHAALAVGTPAGVAPASLLPLVWTTTALSALALLAAVVAVRRA